VCVILFSAFMKLFHLLALALAGFLGYLIGTCPSNVNPPHVPATGSPMPDIPPWPIFKLAVSLNDFLRRATEATTLPRVRVIELSTARWHSHVIFILTKNGIFDAVNSTPLSCEDTAAKLKLHQDFLCRVMVAGETLGLLSRTDGKFGTTPTSALLLSDVVGSQKSFVEMINNPAWDPAWVALANQSLRAGESGFEAAHGTNFWDYAAERPAVEVEFDGAMSSFTAAAAGSILSSYAFPVNGTLCDIGGGEGGTLRLVLDHYPGASGVVFDRPTVAERATAALGAAGLSDRARGIPGSFLDDSLPSEMATCDTFILKHILHDWDDASSIKILKNIQAVAKKGAKLLVVEHVIGVSSAGMERSKAMMDLNMMASCPAGAKERSVPEYEKLFTVAGLSKPVKLVPMRDILSALEVEL